MVLNSITLFIIIFFGILCVFRPFLLIFLFAFIPVLISAPTLTGHINDFKIVQIGPINIFVQDFLILIMIFSFLYLVFFKRKSMGNLLSSPITKIITVVFFWNLFIGFLSYSKGFEVQNVLRYLSTISLMFIAVFIPLIDDLDRKKDRFFQFSVILGLVLVLFGVIRYFITDQVELTSSGTLRSLRANDVLIFLFPVCYILVYSNFWQKHRFGAFILVLIFAVGIHLTGHRSGWLALGLTLMLYFSSIEFDKRYLWVPSICLAFVIAIVLLQLNLRIFKTPGQSFLGDSLVRVYDTFDLENATTQDRLARWGRGLTIIKENPIIGLGSFPVTIKYAEAENNRNLQLLAVLDRGAHNLFVNKMVHEGILGLFWVGTVLFVIIAQLNNRLLADKSYSRFLKFYILSFILFCMFNTSFSSVLGRIYFFISVGFLNAEIVNHSKTEELDSI